MTSSRCYRIEFGLIFAVSFNARRCSRHTHTTSPKQQHIPLRRLAHRRHFAHTQGGRVPRILAGAHCRRSPTEEWRRIRAGCGTPGSRGDIAARALGHREGARVARGDRSQRGESNESRRIGRRARGSFTRARRIGVCREDRTQQLARCLPPPTQFQQVPTEDDTRECNRPANDEVG